jgi:hypothetical protein
MLIDGTTFYGKTSATIGSTIINNTSVTTNDIVATSSFSLGNTYVDVAGLQSRSANLEVLNIVYSSSLGTSQANVYTDQSSINIYANVGYVANSRMTATTLWIQNIYANTISTSGNTTFNQSTWFRGANNYFDNGLTANAVSNFVDANVSGTANVNNLIVNGTSTLKGAISASAPHTSNSYLWANGVQSNSYVRGQNLTTISPDGTIKVSLYSNNDSGVISLSLPAADGTPTQYLGTDGAGHLNFYTLSGNNTTNFVAKSIGVGAGVNASNNNGEIRAAGNITAYYSSDERLKENVKEITNALSMVKSIRGVEFDWTDEWIEENGGEDSYYIRKHDVGVIAQEVEQVLPEVVGTREDGFKAVKYERLVAVLIEAVKELSAEVDRLKNGN